MQRSRYAWPALLWALAIFLFSTVFFSASHTGTIIIPILHFLIPSAPQASLEHWHLLLRKFGHISEYFILCGLIFRALRENRPGWALEWAVWAVVLASLYAATDEFHQIFVPGRTPAIHDVIIDTCGALLAQICLFWWLRRTERPQPGTPAIGD